MATHLRCNGFTEFTVYASLALKVMSFGFLRGAFLFVHENQQEKQRKSEKTEKHHETSSRKEQRGKCSLTSRRLDSASARSASVHLGGAAVAVLQRGCFAVVPPLLLPCQGRAGRISKKAERCT